MEKNLFEVATRQKYRFSTKKGVVGVEDLWDLPLDYLDDIYKTLSKEFDESKSGSLLTESAEGNAELHNKMEIIRHIVNTRMQEAKDNEEKAFAYQKRQKILYILAEKQDDDLRGKSIEELRAMLDEM